MRKKRAVAVSALAPGFKTGGFVLPKLLPI
jgi:hypothetical protein